jgi:serine/threonine protein phosphatase PrpC
MNEEFPLVVFTEATTNLGEDGEPVVVKNGQETVAIGVFDGLGGRSAGYAGLTGGRIASGWASQLTDEFLKQKHGSLSQQGVIQLQQQICQALKKDADEKIKSSRLKGTLVNDRLCTTLAIASISQSHQQDNSFCLNLAWIGDSRIYFLSPSKGLQQLTKDDLTEQNDAFELIRKDPPMSQYITADIHLHPNWQINFKMETFAEKGCVIACTDGCFQYLESPWNFEKLILETLMQSESVRDWKNLLAAEYEIIKQDDISFVLYPVEIIDFNSLKNLYQERFQKLINDFSYESSNYDELKKIWHVYRQDYEEHLTSSYEKITDNIDKEEIFSQKATADSLNKDSSNNSSLVPNKADEVTNSSKTLQDERLKLIQDPEFPDTIQRLLKQADKYVQEQYWAGVINVYTKILEFDTENLYTKCEIGLAYFEYGQLEQRYYHYKTYSSRYYNDAYKWLTIVLENANAKNIDIPINIKENFALILEKIGKYDEGIKVCKEIISTDQNHSFAFELIGHFKFKKGLYEEALQYTEQAINLCKSQRDFQRLHNLDRLRTDILRRYP